MNQSSWVHSKNGSAVFKDSLVRCLQGLTAMRIRGGMFAGAETAALLQVEWVEGANAWFSAANSNTAFTEPRPVPVVVPRSCQTGDVYKIVSTSAISATRIQFGNIPRICSAATLKLSILQVGISGVLAAVGDRAIIVYDQFGVALGQIFDQMGDGRVRVAADDGMQSDYLVINGDAMSRITSTNYAQFRLSYTPFQTWTAGSMTLQLARAELRYRVTACNAPLLSGDMPPSSSSPNLEYAFSGFIDIPVINPSSHVSFALWLSGPVSADRTVTRASLSIAEASSDSQRLQILNLPQNQAISFDTATYASVLLRDMPKYLRSNNSIRLFIDVASRGEASAVPPPPPQPLTRISFVNVAPFAGAQTLEPAHGGCNSKLLRAQLCAHTMGKVEEVFDADDTHIAGAADAASDE
jgi:hypothetical protein